MPCSEAAQLLKRISYAQSVLRNVRKPGAMPNLSESDKKALEKRAKQDMRLANSALKEHHLVCEICDQEG
jgi:hypothetical protein